MDHFLTTSATLTHHHRHRLVFVVGTSVQGHANKAWQVRTQAGWGRKEEGGSLEPKAIQLRHRTVKNQKGKGGGGSLSYLHCF